MKAELYGYADVGRYGLAHSILAWARCAVWCNQVGAQMLAPKWFRLRVGPLLRGERDKRAYHLLFNNAGKPSGLTREWLLRTSRTVSSEVAVRNGIPTSGGRTVVIFVNALADNDKKHFHEIRGHRRMLRDELVAMTRPQYRPAAPSERFIGVHVRLGDFTAAPDSTTAIFQNNVRLPLPWYVEKLKQLRAGLGDMPAIIFSDGADEELSALLAEPNTRRAPKQSSVTDMLSMSEASVLISSGSGFSLWGAFLGDIPRVCFPGRTVAQAHDDPAMTVESAINSELPPPFFDTVHRVTRSVSA